MSTAFAKRDLTFTKFDDEQRIAYGWAIVSTEGGKPYFDLQGDHIPMSAVIPAAIDFMKNSRASDDMHRERKTGDVVFAVPVTKDTVMDPTNPGREGLWIGTHVADDGVWAALKKGERRGYSIGGFLDAADYVSKGKTLATLLKNATFGIRGVELRKADDAHVESLAKGNKPQRIFRSFRLGFISTVDWPAQEGARISIVKSKDGVPQPLLWIRKGVVLTSSDDGHQHVIDPDCYDEDGRGSTSCAITGDGEFHSHPFLVGDALDITIGDNAGHGHDTDATATPVAEESPPDDNEPAIIVVEARDPNAPPVEKNEKNNKPLVPGVNSAVASVGKETNKMSTDADKTIADLKDQLAVLTKRAERAEKMATMSDSHKSYANRLSVDGQGAFLAKSAVERDAEVKAQVVYTAPTGEVFYSFDDPRTVSLAKRADESDKTAKEQTAIAKRGEYISKARETMSAYPGTDEQHAAVIASIESISDEAVKKAAYESLAAGQAAISKRMSVNGIAPVVRKGNDAPGTTVEKAEEALKLSVEEYRKSNNLPSYEVAFAKGSVSDSKVREAYDALQDARAGGN